MLSAFALALGQLTDRRVLRLLVKSLAVTIAVFAVLGAAGWWGLDWLFAFAGLADARFAGAEGVRGLAALLAVLIGGWLLWRVVALAVSFLAVAALFQVVDGAQVMGAGMLRGLHDTRVPMYYAAADVSLLPSYYESFGMVALEAMACGSPVIASRVGGLTTTVRDGVTGFLVPEGNVTALAERIDALIDDPDLGWRMGMEGIRWAAEHRWPCVAEAVCREYASLTEEAAEHLSAARCR